MFRLIRRPPILSLLLTLYSHGRGVRFSPAAEADNLAPDCAGAGGRVQPSQLERALGAPGRLVAPLSDPPRDPTMGFAEGYPFGDQLLGAVCRVEPGVAQALAQPRGVELEVLDQK